MHSPCKRDYLGSIPIASFMESYKNCLHCQGKTSKKAKKFCSLKCQANYNWLQKVQKIESEGFSEKDSYSRASTMRKYLIHKNGRKCSQCNLEFWLDKPIPLVMDHIDGNPSNNSFSNLRMICCNCDGLSSTYKGRNKGKGFGRRYRRERYSEGKTW